jgi:uncharacterized DUF497 family protein
MHIAQLILDVTNIPHIARHQVNPDEVEQACQQLLATFPGKSGRILVVGKSQAGRILSLVLAPKGDGVYYVVTARDASRTERRLIKGGELT